MPRGRRKKPSFLTFTLPGSYISTIEEFSAEGGAYEEGGGVYSSRVGVPDYDKIEHYVSVKPLKKTVVEELRVGSPFLGRITDVKKNFAQATIFATDPLGRMVPFSALLHISRSGIRRARTISELVKPGDEIVARLATNWVPFQISIEGPEFGVIRASCSRCGQPLTWDHDGILRCNNCGHREGRKVSVYYGGNPKSFFAHLSAGNS